MLDSQVLRWVLKEKYHWSEVEILAALRPGYEFPDEVSTDVRRLESGEPLAYVIGWVHFLECHVDLRFRPLIPRPETEDWVAKVIAQMPTGAVGGRVIDLCCGSGCIGLAFLRHLPSVELTFVDLSEDAVRQTVLNLELNQVNPTRARVVRSDLFAQVPVAEKFDLIVCNPPYIDPASEYGEELRFEPSEALFAERQGLVVIERVVAGCLPHLAPGGRVVLEFAAGQAEAIEQLFAHNKITQYTFHPDQFGVTRWVEFLGKA